MQLKLLLKTCTQDGEYMIYQNVTKLFIFYVSDLFVLRGSRQRASREYISFISDFLVLAAAEVECGAISSFEGLGRELFAH